MKKSKLILSILASILVIVLPFVTVISLAVALPAQYDNTFVSELTEKYDRLASLDEAKVVVIGGSSVAFGLNSELLEEYLHMPVVNFGMYAALGTKVMLDLSLDEISEGDIVILAPELDAQTLSLYFNSETTLQAIDDEFSLFFKLDSENWFSMLGGMWNFVVNKISYLINGNKPNPDGVYNANNFNEYGDVNYTRDENVMWEYYDPNSMITLDKSIVSSDFLDYLNDYIKSCEKRGATVYFSYCPMNEMALVEGTTSETISRFENYLQKNIHCTFISSLEDSIMEAGYFYDTNLHLNDAGVTAHTVSLIKDLYLEMGNPKKVNVTVPDAPELPGHDVVFNGEDANDVYFTYELLADHSYAISGLTDLGKTQSTLTLPLGYNGYMVTKVLENAFSGGILNELIIPENTNIRSLADGCFTGASSLSILRIYFFEESNILPPSSFTGVASNFIVYIPASSNYPSGYFWGERGLTFEYMN